MSLLKAPLLAALVSVLVTAGCLFFIHHRRAAEAAGLRHANSRMRFEANQRRHVSQAATGPAGRGAAAEIPDGAATPNPETAGDYRNEGQANPLATLQTLAWACDRGDTATVQKLICFEGAGRAKAEAYMTSLPESARGSWKSPEAMAASLLTSDGMYHPFPNSKVLGTATVEQISVDRVMLRLPGTAKDRTEYQKTDAGWSYLITEAAVAAYLDRPKAEPPSAH
jgi:hypothetical protein